MNIVGRDAIGSPYGAICDRIITLAAWRNKLQYDASHHASRKKLAEDDNAIQQLETDIHRDRRELDSERR